MISPAVEAFLILVGIYLIMAWSLQLPLASGQFFVAQPALVAIGAYRSGVVSKAGVAFGFALAVGCLAGLVFAFLMGIPSLRLKGMAMAIVSIGFFEIVRVFFLNFKPTGGVEGLIAIPLRTNLPLVWFIVFIILILLSRLSRSRLGRAMEALNDDPEAAEAMGVNAVAVKLFAFAASGLLAGLGGALYAHYLTFIASSMFSFGLLVNLFAFVVVGGSTSHWGPVIGTPLLWLLPEFARGLAQWRGVFMAAVLVGVVLFRSHGIITKDMVGRLTLSFSKATGKWAGALHSTGGRDRHT